MAPLVGANAEHTAAISLRCGPAGRLAAIPDVREDIDDADTP